MIIVSLGWRAGVGLVTVLVSRRAEEEGAGTGFMAMVSRKIMKIG